MKSGFVAVVGRPSAGKSTLINTLCGAKVSIVSPVPQTTRNRIRGIVNREAGQLVFVDTPGLHFSEKKMNARLTAAAEKSLGDADLTLYLIDAARKAGEEEEGVARLIRERLGEDCGAVFAAINKIDCKAASREAAREFLAERLPALIPARIFEISARTGEGVDALLSALFEAAAEGEPWYDRDCYTDQDVRFRVAEIIREKCIERLREELPHCIHVEVEDAELRGAGSGRETLWVRASILTERESQKGMVVGKGGAGIKAIRAGTMAELRRIFDWKLELQLRVKAAPDWRRNDAILKTFR
jgi:GTP-binding protein Era